MPAMLTPYRRILGRRGARLFFVTGLVARLPISMVGLGIVVLVQRSSGSYALAGSVSAAHLVANASLAVVQGRMLDRLGQSRVLPVVITAWGVALSALVWSVRTDQPILLTYALAALAGACLPSVGTSVRARWAHVLGSGERQTAFALEAVADEVVFMTGPVVVTVLATAVSPVAGLLTAVVVGVGFTWAFAAQRDTEPPAHARVDAGARARMPWVTLVPLTVASTALGSLFGSAEVTTVAFADEHGVTAFAGVLLALWAAGSMVAGLVSGAVTWRRGPQVRLRAGAALMTLTMLPLTLVDAPLLMGAVLFVAGFAIAPTLISSISLAEQVLPPTRLSEGMAFLQTGIVAGVAPGAALAGLVIDAHGSSAGYLVSAAGGVLALLAALVTRAPVAVAPGLAHSQRA